LVVQGMQLGVGIHRIPLAARENHIGLTRRDQRRHVRCADAEGPGIHGQTPAPVLLEHAVVQDGGGRIHKSLEAGNLEESRGCLVTGAEPGDRFLGERVRSPQVVRGPAHLHSERDGPAHSDVVPPARQFERDHAAQRVTEHDEVATYRKLGRDCLGHGSEGVRRERGSRAVAREVRSVLRVRPGVPDAAVGSETVQQHQIRHESRLAEDRGRCWAGRRVVS
jgi:hypothetical protein